MLIKRTDKSTKVIITEAATPEELESKFPMLKVKSDNAGQCIRTPQYIRTPHYIRRLLLCTSKGH